METAKERDAEYAGRQDGSDAPARSWVDKIPEEPYNLNPSKAAEEAAIDAANRKKKEDQVVDKFNAKMRRRFERRSQRAIRANAKRCGDLVSELHTL